MGRMGRMGRCGELRAMCWISWRTVSSLIGLRVGPVGACGFGSGGRFLRWRSEFFGFRQIWNLVRMIRVDNAHTVGVCLVRRRHHGNHYQN